MVTRRPLLLVPLLACAVYLVLHELRVTAFAQIELGPLTSRFAHDLLLLVTAGSNLFSATTAPVSRSRAA